MLAAVAVQQRLGPAGQRKQELHLTCSGCCWCVTSWDRLLTGSGKARCFPGSLAGCMWQISQLQDQVLPAKTLYTRCNKSSGWQYMSLVQCLLAIAHTVTPLLDPILLLHFTLEYTQSIKPCNTFMHLVPQPASPAAARHGVQAACGACSGAAATAESALRGPAAVCFIHAAAWQSHLVSRTNRDSQQTRRCGFNRLPVTVWDSERAAAAAAACGVQRLRHAADCGSEVAQPHAVWLQRVCGLCWQPRGCSSRASGGGSL